MLIMTGCSIGHESHEDGDGHHSEDANQPSHGHTIMMMMLKVIITTAALASPGDVSSVDRVISVVMVDTTRFLPDSFDVVAGETI